jgi:hypothetical protein
VRELPKRVGVGVQRAKPRGRRQGHRMVQQSERIAAAVSYKQATATQESKQGLSLCRINRAVSEGHESSCTDDAA